MRDKNKTTPHSVNMVLPPKTKKTDTTTHYIAHIVFRLYVKAN